MDILVQHPGHMSGLYQYSGETHFLLQGHVVRDPPVPVGSIHHSQAGESTQTPQSEGVLIQFWLIRFVAENVVNDNAGSTREAKK